MYYFDFASTAYPRPESVLSAIQAGCRIIGSPGRSSDFEPDQLLFDARKTIADCFGLADPSNLVFGSGATHLANLLIAGLINPNTLILISPYEHNAVLRVLWLLRGSCAAIGVLRDQDHIQLFDLTAAETEWNLLTAPSFSLEEFAQTVQEKTSPTQRIHRVLCVWNLVSNVSGRINPLAPYKSSLQYLADFYSVPLLTLVDASQAAGHLPLSLESLDADGFFCSGHKSLLGPPGIGIGVLTSKLENCYNPAWAGGTGSLSDQLEMPRIWPDRFEPGTPNLPAILGLAAAVRYYSEKGEEIRQDTHTRWRALLQALAALPELEWVDWHPEEKGRLTRSGESPNPVPVLSLRIPGMDLAAASFFLQQQGIITRAGLHCAPLAHQKLGTYPSGTLRLSIGPSLPPEAIPHLIQSLQILIHHKSNWRSE